MKNLSSGLVFAVLMAAAVPGLAQTESRLAAAPAAQRAPAVTTTRKGVIQTISETSVVVIPSDNKKAQLTFELTPDIKRTGLLTAGDAVAVTYYLEKARPVVTALTGKKTASSGNAAETAAVQNR